MAQHAPRTSGQPSFRRNIIPLMEGPRAIGLKTCQPEVEGATVAKVEGLLPDEAAAAIPAAATPTIATQTSGGKDSIWACLTPAGLPAASGSATAIVDETRPMTVATAITRFIFDIRHPNKCCFSQLR